LKHCLLMTLSVGLCPTRVDPNGKQDHQALLKARYYPRVAAASGTHN